MERYSASAIDALGRILLKREIRKKLHWETGDKIAIYHVDKNTLILQLAEAIDQQETKAIFMSEK